jgi:hypothetical protein
MTTNRDLVIHAGQAFTLSLPYAGTAGRGQRMHIRWDDGTATVVQILTHNGDANARVLFDGTDAIDITIGASVSAPWLVGDNRVEWVYDIEDYDLADDDDVVIPYRGRVVVYGNRTRPEDITPSPQLPSGDGRYVRFDGVQGLTAEQKTQVRDNIDANGSGDVVGPASATDDRLAAFDGITGKLIKQGSVTATAVASHLGSTSNPHSVTAAQVGADASGTAASAFSAHTGASDPHGDRAYADGLAVNYATAAQGALPATINATTGEPTGIDTANTGTLAFTYGSPTSTVTVTPVNATMDIWLSGVKYALTGVQTINFTTANGIWFISYTAGGWVASQTPWTISASVAPVALVYVNTTLGAGLLADERHGITMDWATHSRLHNVDGAQISSGGAISGTGPTYFPATNGNPALGANLFAIASATLRDEDIVLTTPAVASGGPYFIARRTGAADVWTWVASNSFPFLATSYTAGSNYIQYNQFTGGAWQMTDLASGQFVNYYVFATDFINPAGAGVIIIPGQAVHASLAAAQAESVLALSLAGFPSAEFAPLYQVTFLASNNNNWNDMPGRCAIAAVPVRIVGFKISISAVASPSSHAALSNRSDAGSHPASAVTVGTLDGNLLAASATDLETVMQEIDELAFAAFTVAALPSAAKTGRLIYVSNESGGAVVAFADGTNWRRVTDRAIVS